jgi:hypothetical protein
MLADELDFVVGVDRHRDSHALAVVEVGGAVVVVESGVAADSGGYAQALRVAGEHAPGWRAFAIEGAGSFGAGLTRFLAERGEPVFEIGRLRRQRRSGGKTDALDAVRAGSGRARTETACDAAQQWRTGGAPRVDGRSRGSGERKAGRSVSAARPAHHHTRAAP